MLARRLSCVVLLVVGASSAALDVDAASAASRTLLYEAGAPLASGAPVTLALEAEYCKPSVGEGAWRVPGSVTTNRAYRGLVALDAGEHECRSWNWPGIGSAMSLDDAIVATGHGATRLVLRGTGEWGFLDCRWRFRMLRGTLTGNQVTAQVSGNAHHVAGTESFCGGTQVVELTATLLGADEMPLEVGPPAA
jgi:hypothetical protein